jgi:hypothetical protein
MSTHTTHFCDYCNSDRDISYGHNDDDGHAINYSEYPVGDGWAEFLKPYTDRLGYKRDAEYHICAHCLADPEFDPSRYGKIAEWDKASQENLEKGRKHGEMYAWADENLGSRDRWGRRGVRQVFGDVGYWFGPKMADGRFSPSDRVREAA